MLQRNCFFYLTVPIKNNKKTRPLQKTGQGKEEEEEKEFLYLVEQTFQNISSTPIHFLSSISAMILEIRFRNPCLP